MIKLIHSFLNCFLISSLDAGPLAASASANMSARVMDESPVDDGECVRLLLLIMHWCLDPQL
jgi:hypothetical protein